MEQGTKYTIWTLIGMAIVTLIGCIIIWSASPAHGFDINDYTRMNNSITHSYGSSSAYINGSNVTGVIRTTPGYSHQTYSSPNGSASSWVRITSHPNMNGTIVRSHSSVSVRGGRQCIQRRD